MSLEIPHGSNYEIAMRPKRRRDARRVFFDAIVGILIICGYVALIALVPFLLYWIIEIGGSLIIDALVYVIVPFFAIGLFVALCQNWKAVWRAIGRAFLDMLDMLLMR